MMKAAAGIFFITNNTDELMRMKYVLVIDTGNPGGKNSWFTQKQSDLWPIAVKVIELGSFDKHCIC